MRMMKGMAKVIIACPQSPRNLAVSLRFKAFRAFKARPWGCYPAPAGCSPCPNSRPQPRARPSRCSWHLPTAEKPSNGSTSIGNRSENAAQRHKVGRFGPTSDSSSFSARSLKVSSRRSKELSTRCTLLFVVRLKSSIFCTCSSMRSNFVLMPWMASALRFSAVLMRFTWFSSMECVTPMAEHETPRLCQARDG